MFKVKEQYGDEIYDVFETREITKEENTKWEGYSKWKEVEFLMYIKENDWDKHGEFKWVNSSNYEPYVD